MIGARISKWIAVGWRSQLCFLLFGISIGYILLLTLPDRLLRDGMALVDGMTLNRLQIEENRSKIEMPGYPIVVVEFDQSSMIRIGANARSPTVPQQSIAAVLRQVLDLGRKQPAIVYLDIAAYDTAVADDPATLELSQVINQWARTPNAPILGIFAGRACQTIEPWNHDIFNEDMTPGVDGTLPATGKIFWSCPVFDRLTLVQQEWRCVRRNETGASGIPSLVALPSPTMLAQEVRHRRTRPTPHSVGKTLSSRVATATVACRNGNSRHDIPVSRIAIPQGGESAARSLLVGHRQLVTPVSASSVLAGNLDSSLFEGTVLVIGRNHFMSDSFEANGEALPGSWLVGLALRDALMGNPLAAPSWMISFFILAIAACGTFGMSSLLEKQWAKWRKRRTKFWPRTFQFSLTRQQLIIFLSALLLINAAVILNPRMLVPLVVGILSGEFAIMVNSLWSDWNERA